MSKSKIVQKNVRVQNPDLLAECSLLLKEQLGAELPQAHVVTAALTALRVMHRHELITRDDCRKKSIENACIVSSGILQRLLDERLLASGEYEVTGDLETGAFILTKDGEILTGEKPEPGTPDWVNDIITKQPGQKRAVN